MSKKAFLIILVLSVMVTVSIPIAGFITNQYKVSGGLPFRFTEFSFLGSSTNYLSLFIDITFWFVVIFVIWKVLQKLIGK